MSEPREVVLDSSAVLALLGAEPGAEVVAGVVPAAAISAVNLAEVVVVLGRHGMPASDARRVMDGLGLRVVDADAALAHDAGGIKAPARGGPLALGDRFCLATARALGVPAVTADKAWERIDAGVRIRVIR